MSTYPSELIACVAILIAVMIFRELPSAVRVPLSFSVGAELLAWLRSPPLANNRHDALAI